MYLDEAYKEDLRYQASMFESSFGDGYSEGKREGEISTLQKLLIKRFGTLDSDSLHRLNAANSAQISCWIDRVFDAATLNAVFEEH